MSVQSLVSVSIPYEHAFIMARAKEAFWKAFNSFANEEALTWGRRDSEHFQSELAKMRGTYHWLGYTLEFSDPDTMRE